MAYLTTLAACEKGSLEAYRKRLSKGLNFSSAVGVSHLLAYWIPGLPIATSMTEAIDGGAILDKRLWHKFRPPLVHEQVDVSRLAAQLKSDWAETLEGPYENLRDDSFLFFVPQIEKVIGIFEAAAARQELIVSAVDYHAIKAPLFRKKFKLAAP